MKTFCSKTNIHIVDSYYVSKKQMRRILIDIENNHPYCEVFKERTYTSLVNEWRTHNLLYNLGIARERTKDVDLDIPQKWYFKVVYAILGVIAYPLIR